MSMNYYLYSNGNEVSVNLWVKGKGCLAEIIGFASPLLQQH